MGGTEQNKVEVPSSCEEFKADKKSEDEQSGDHVALGDQQ